MTSATVNATTTSAVSLCDSSLLIEHIRSLVNAKDILYTWTIRELKVRYADTRLGFAWLLVYPAAWVLLFTFLFSYVIPVPLNGAPYPLFAMCGLAPWFFFSSTTSNAVSSLKNNSNLIPKVYFPREILPLGSVLVGFADFSMYIVLIGAMLIYYKTGIGWTALLLIPVTLSLAAITLAVSLTASRMALFSREVQLLVPMVLQFFMYCLPIFYPTNVVPARFRSLYLLNPVAALIDSFRRILVYGLSPQWTFLSIAMAASFTLLALAYWDFKRAEPEFADRL